jgi:2-hydroxy-3-keto-5-methylthiopentenyl-1-phosphate phosphatase
LLPGLRKEIERIDSHMNSASVKHKSAALLKKHSDAIIDGHTCAVFFDFDNTITQTDILDDIIERFSINKDWVRIEKLWQAGSIGSRECLEQQLAGVRISKDDLREYLAGIKIDPCFKPLVSFLRSRSIEPMILSDSFNIIIKYILSHNGLDDIKIIANSLRIEGDILVPSFPHSNSKCFRCAHCKHMNVVSNGAKKKTVIYIGDGLSDVCPAEHCDIVFAKANLLESFRSNGSECIEFTHLGDVQDFFMEVEHAG